MGCEVDSGTPDRKNLPSFDHTRMLGSAEIEASLDRRPEERVAGKNQEESKMCAFAISETLQVFSVKIVKSEYVDMSELLKGNIEAERRCFRAEGDNG